MQNGIFGYETNFISQELIQEYLMPLLLLKLEMVPSLMILESKEKV